MMNHQTESNSFIVVVENLNQTKQMENIRKQQKMLCLYCHVALLGITWLHLSQTQAAPISNSSSPDSSSSSSISVYPISPEQLTKLVIFSFDGFRPDYVNANDTPNLYALYHDGVRGHMRSTMVTKTYPNHQSIVTGLYEPYHGIINNEFEDPLLRGEQFDVDRPSDVWWDQNNISVPIYIANQLAEPGRFSATMQWPGAISSYTDGTGRNTSQRYRPHYLTDYDKNMNWYKRIDQVFDWLTSPTNPANLALIYFSEPDSTAHQYGPFSAQVKEQIIHLDQIVGYYRQLLVKTKLLQRTNTIFLSDHGMAEVRDTPDRVFHLEHCDQKYPGLRYHLAGVSPVYSILPLSAPTATSSSTNMTIAVRDCLNQCARELFNGKFKVYLQEEIPLEYHYRGNRRILPLFLLADDEHDVVYNNSNGWRPKGWPVWGNHGYNNSLPSMQPLFIAQGRSFKRNYQHPNVFENVDLYPLMLHLMQIPVTRFASNGTFEHVKGMLSRVLYLNDDDYFRAHTASDATLEATQLWFRVIAYFGLGFACILLAGTCFVMTAGLKLGSYQPTRSSLFGGRVYAGDDAHKSQTLLSALVSRFQGKRGSRARLRGSVAGNYHHYDHQSGDYRMFSHSRPNRHLDSSFDTDDDDENELYNKCDSGNRQNARMNHSRSGSRATSANNLTEIDWDIIGTGLDIDLQSQLRPHLRPEHKRYVDDENEDDEEEMERAASDNNHAGGHPARVKLLRTTDDDDYDDDAQSSLLLTNGSDNDSDHFSELATERIKKVSNTGKQGANESHTSNEHDQNPLIDI